MRLRSIAAATAASAALTLAAAGTSQAATTTSHHTPVSVTNSQVNTTYNTAGRAILRSGIKGMHTNAAASCGLENIGAPGSFGYQGTYAGQVEQMWDTCSGRVVAHWQFADGFINSGYNGTPVSLAVGDPYGGTLWADNAGYAISSQKNVYLWGPKWNVYSPDAWRVGAEVNDCQWISWGTLHNYAGYDQNGPVVTSGQGTFPSAPF
ncbi:hypothetical protein AB0M29_19150 [Streptomyces sp. NPDC051976]|uniref:hypothetical protein n=1 Tax=Streptomyces sp. NPDC051976 TaxID=3154947 RepID=UPI003418DABB